MLFTAVLAAIAAVPVVTALDVTASSTRCTTRFGYYPLPTGTGAVPTWYRYTTTTNIIRVTTTSHETVTVTPSATTLTDVISTITTLTTTVTSTPAATTVPTPAGFIPLLVANLAGPTAVSRFRRHELEHRAADYGVHNLRRQTAANHTGGFAVNREGQTSNMYRIYPQRVDCRVSVSINSTIETTVIGEPETILAAGATATALSTTTISTTTTLTEVLPRQTVYAACQQNNVGAYLSCIL